LIRGGGWQELPSSLYFIKVPYPLIVVAGDAWGINEKAGRE